MKFINKVIPRRIQKLLRIYFYDKSEFGFRGDNVSISHDTVISNTKNVYLYGNNGLQQAVLLTTNAKFIMKRIPARLLALKYLQVIMPA